MSDKIHNQKVNRPNQKKKKELNKGRIRKIAELFSSHPGMKYEKVKLIK